MKTLNRRRPSVTALQLQETSKRITHALAEWQTLTPFQRRVLLRNMGYPRSLYKYRAIPPHEDALGRERFEQLLLHNQLWMSNVSSFNDPFEGQATYEVPYTGPELRRRWELKLRRMGFTSAQAKARVSSEDVAHPERLASRGQRALAITLSRMGMCALSADPSNPLLWAHYSQSHTGVCVQLTPVRDLAALMPVKVEYSDEYPVLTDILDDADKRNILPFMRKSRHWAYEQEWRLVEQERANFPKSFDPSAMGAVILGMRISDADRAYVFNLVEQRQVMYGTRPVVYQAERHPRRYRIVLKRQG